MSDGRDLLPRCAIGPGPGEETPDSSDRCRGYDILEQADWFKAQANALLGKRWEQAVSRTLLRLMKNSRSGALCRFKAVELHGVRHLVIAGFHKYLVFSRIEQDAQLILRMIHGARELGSLL
jgi:toxin ParE1/3/4